MKTYTKKEIKDLTGFSDNNITWWRRLLIRAGMLQDRKDINTESLELMIICKIIEKEFHIQRYIAH